jgi:hypothetical protein
VPDNVIRSPGELRDYLVSARTQRRLSPNEIEQIHSSVRFIQGRFKGMDAGPLVAKWTEVERRQLIVALGGPTIIPDTMPDRDGNCTVPRDNFWCAQY